MDTPLQTHSMKTSPHNRQIAAWLLFCCVMVFTMVVLGGVTRLTGSGLSMVEWDPIFGIVPPLDREQWQGVFELYKQSPRLAVDYLTKYSVTAGNATVKRWRKLGEHLIVRFLDGNMKDERGEVTHPAYPESWYRRVVDEDGEHFEMKKLPGETETH